MTNLCPTPLTSAERVRVHATAWAILGDPHAADDVVQDLSLRLGSSVDEVRPGARGAWMARQAIGLSMNHRRGERRRAHREREAGLHRAAARVEPPELALERGEDLDQVRSALAGLEERQRLPIVLRYFHGRRLAEISRILDVPVSTAHERLQRGLTAMRGALRGTEVVPALIGLAIPRAAVVVAPTVVVGRVSMLVGSSYWAARAGAILVAASLGPQALGPDTDRGVTQLRVASAAPIPRRLDDPVVPLNPPSIVSEEDLSGGAPPMQPPVESEDPEPWVRPGPASELPVESDNRPDAEVAGGLSSGVAVGLKAPPGQAVGGLISRGSDMGEAPPRRADQDNGTGNRYETGSSTDPGGGGGALGSTGVSGGGPGGGLGGDGSDRELPAVKRTLLGGGVLEGQILFGGQRPAAGLWVVVSGEEPGEEEEAQPEDRGRIRAIAVALTDRHGHFHVEVPRPVQELVVQVGAVGESGAFKCLPLRVGSLESGRILRLEVE